MRFFGIIVSSMMITNIMGQTFEGVWIGKVSGQNGSINGEMIIKTTGNNQINGELVVLGDGERDSYSLKGTTSGSMALGKLTFSDGTIFDFSMTLSDNQIQQKISFHGQSILQGSFTKKNSTSISSSAPSVKPDNLNRDPRLVGKWVHSENYSSSGGFYGGIQSTIILNADGTMDDGGSTSYASGSGNSVMNKGDGNDAVSKLKAMGARWFTKGNIFCWRIPVNGKITDVESSKYYIENGALLLTDLQTGKKTLYQKSN